MGEGISRLISLTEVEGLHGQLTSWSEADVWWFDCTMPESVRLAGLSDQSLRYFETKATPHDRADAGFKDDGRKVAISFAREN